EGRCWAGPTKDNRKTRPAEPDPQPRLPSTGKSTLNKTPRTRLLDLRSGAGLFQLLLDRVRLGLRHAFLDLRGHAFDQVLGFLQAQARDLADDLDDADLVGAEAGHGDVELGLLLGGGSSGTSGVSSGHGDGGS